MPKYVVNDWTQIKWDGQNLTGGDTFEAEAEDVAALSQYVSPVPEDPEPEPEEEPAPKAKPAAKNKAAKASPNK